MPTPRPRPFTPGQARLGRVPSAHRALYQASLEANGQPITDADLALHALSRLFPNLSLRSLDAEPIDPALGLWLVRVPLLVETVLASGREFSYTVNEATRSFGVYVPLP